MILSFRARLTLSYTILTALLLTVALCAIAALVVARTVQATNAALDDAAKLTRATVAAHWSQPDRVIIAYVTLQPESAGARITPHPRRPPPRPAQAEPGGFGPPPQPGFGPPQSDGPPRPAPGTQPPPGAYTRPPPRGFWLVTLLGIHAQLAPLHDGVIEIAPDDTLRDTLELIVGAFGLAELVTIVASWAIGRALTRQAMRPLATVTAELQRFARGDFAPSPLATSDAGELADLVSAYNGAAAQVVAAFNERERTERHLRLFLGEAGHEMRTPMTVISAYLDLLAGDGRITSAETLQSARTHMRRLRDLVERVMALARMEGNDLPNAELIDVVEIAQEAIAAVTAVRGGTVRLRHDSDDVVVRAESWELREAIGNLVENAIVYGNDTPVDVAIATADRTIVIRVRDGGPGISPSDRARLFDHFFRGEASAGTSGTGLGLAIVERAAARLGGEIVLEDPGYPGGATFRLTIPVYQPTARPARQTVG